MPRWVDPGPRVASIARRESDAGGVGRYRRRVGCPRRDRVIVALKPGNRALDGIGLDGTMLVRTPGSSIRTGVLVALAPAFTTGRLNCGPRFTTGAGCIGWIVRASRPARAARCRVRAGDRPPRGCRVVDAQPAARSERRLRIQSLEFFRCSLSPPPAQTSVQRAEHHRQALETSMPWGRSKTPASSGICS